MLRGILSFVLAVIPALIWLLFILPLVYRAWGISLPLNPRKRRQVSLNADQRFYLEGFAGFGVSLFIYELADHYLNWALFGNPSDRPTWQTVVDALGVGICAGVLTGLFSGIHDARAKLNKPPPK